MTILNAQASRLALANGIPCATDVTGFGLLRHLFKLARASGVSAVVDHAAVRLNDDAHDRSADPAGADEPWTEDGASETLRSVAAAGFVLARNEDSLLPLDPQSLRRVAVLGPNAAVPRTLGGGSATVFPPYRISPLDGLRSALDPNVIVDHSPGVRSHTQLPVAPPALLHLPGNTGPGALVEFIANDGTVLDTEHRAGGSCTWRTLPQTVTSADLAAVRVTTTVRAVTSGTHIIGCSGHGRFRLTFDGELAFDTYLSVPGGTDPTEAHIRRPPQHSAAVSLQAGRSVDVTLDHDVDGLGHQTSFALGGVSFQLNIEEPYRPDDDEIIRAVRLARDADVAVVVVGTTEEVESEGFDRATLGLPGRQDQLVRRVADANPRTVVVVVNTGAQVLVPWADTVPAVLLTLFPGQEYGNTLADVQRRAERPGMSSFVSGSRTPGPATGAKRSRSMRPARTAPSNGPCGGWPGSQKPKRPREPR